MVCMFNMRNNTPVGNEPERYSWGYQERRFTEEFGSFRDIQSNYDDDFGSLDYQEDGSVLQSSDFVENSHDNEESARNNAAEQVARSSEQMFLPDLDSVDFMQSYLASPLVPDFGNVENHPNNNESQVDSENTVRHRRSNLGDRALNFNEIDASALAVLLEGLQDIPGDLNNFNTSNMSRVEREDSVTERRRAFVQREINDEVRYMR